MERLRCPECESEEFQVTFVEAVKWPLEFTKDGKYWEWGRADILGYEKGDVMEVECARCEYVLELTKELEEFILSKC